MFHTLDALQQGNVFWQSLQDVRRTPFDPSASRQTATLSSLSHGLALLLAWRDEGSEERMLVQLRDVENGKVLVGAELDSAKRYLSGQAFGSPVDEFAAAEALALYAWEMHGNDWELLIAEDEAEGEDHGDE